MTDETAFLTAICADPDDDTARLVYADWLQEHEQETRAEFIRAQVELAHRISQEIGGVRHYHDWATGTRTADLERVERDLLLSVPSLKCDGFIQVRSHDYFGALDSHRTVAYRRGFIESVKCPAAAWLAHGDAISWNPTQTVQCKAVGPHHGDTCSGGRVEAPNAQFTRACAVCGGSGQVSRPCPPTAHPVRVVTLTTWPEHMSQFNRERYHLFLEDRWPGVNFTLPA